MKYFRLSLFVICFTLVFSSCEKSFLRSKFTSSKKENVSDDVPLCISDLIIKIKSEPVTNPAATVWRYDYKGQTVYYIPATACCDQASRLFNSHCDLICCPDGGFTGYGDGKCTDFFSERKNETLIWKDTR